MKEALRKIDTSFSADDLTQMDALQKTLNTLVIEREALAKLPTWPWRPGTFTGVTSAILLPSFLLIVQMLIQRLIGN